MVSLPLLRSLTVLSAAGSSHEPARPPLTCVMCLSVSLSPAFPSPFRYARCSLFYQDVLDSTVLYPLTHILRDCFTNWSGQGLAGPLYTDSFPLSYIPIILVLVCSDVDT